jgi:negative regulator of flagellin synthesis FlgM
LNYLDGIGSSQQAQGATETSASAGAARMAKSEPGSMSVAGAADDATLSTTASVMAQTLLGSDVRSDKVTALQQSIAAGTYSVPSSDVADTLMRALLQ